MNKKVLAALGVLAAVSAAPAQSAVTVQFNNANVVEAPGLTDSATLGNEMTGLDVSVTFSNGFSQTLDWGTTGATSGGVTGTGWGLSLTGNTFSSPWNFTISPNANLGYLTTLILNGSDNFTIFDTDFGGAVGTPGSATGASFEVLSGGTFTGTATYSNQVRIGAAAPVGDIYQTLTVAFDPEQGPRADWSFRQDTDNDSRAIPEPGSMALVALGLAGLALMRRRSRAS